MISTRALQALLFAVTTLVISACDKRPSDVSKLDSSKVLATVNGEPITENDYQHYLRLRQQRQGPIADKENEKKIVLDEMIERTLLVQNAMDQKLDQDPEIRFLMKRIRENLLVQAAVRKELQKNPITDEDVKKRFEQEAANTYKTEYRVRHILVKTEDEAKDIIKKLKGGAKFPALAKKRSIDTQSAKNGGELGDWINQGMVVPEFFDALTKMKKGDISAEPVKTNFGWHVIQVEETRPLKIPNFEEFVKNPQAKANLQQKLQNERIEAMAGELRSKAKITIN